MSLIFVTGISTSGKSTVAKELQNRGYEAYDTEHNGISAWFNRETGGRFRHADIFPPAKEDQLGGEFASTNEEGVDGLIHAGGHEISHLLGIEHEAAASYLTRDKTVRTLYEFAKPAPAITDIGTYFQEKVSIFDEYGSVSSPMGDRTAPIELWSYNPVQQDGLRIPFPI